MVENGDVVLHHHGDENTREYRPVITRIERDSSLSFQGGFSIDDKAKNSSISSTPAITTSCPLHSCHSSSLMNTRHTSSTYSSQQTTNRIEMIPLRNQHLFQQECGFTRHQAIEYWIQKKIVQSRGEGANLLHLLMALGIVEHRRIINNIFFQYPLQV